MTMKLIKLFLSLRIFALSFFLLASHFFYFPIVFVDANPTLDGVIQKDEYTQSKTYDNNNFELHWRVESPNFFMAIRAKTKGWVSVGFSPTVMMKDADMIIGWVESNNEVKIFDAFSTGDMGPHPPDENLGGNNDIIAFGGTESGEWTTLEFQRKLDTGDKYDKVFPSSGNIKIIVAYGSRDEFASMHRFRATDSITVEAAKVEKKYKEISAMEAKQLYDSDYTLMILDVSSAWKNGHLPGAVNIEFNQLTQNLGKFNKERPILVYCHGDAPAIFAADLLSKNGFSAVYRLLGNYGAWTREGFPVEKYKEVTKLKFQIGNEQYWLDETLKTMDTRPVILEGRTMLPIRFLAEALGARVGWEANLQQVSIYLQFIEVKLQIGNAMAVVNGKNTAIDPSNEKVKPIVVPPGRTLLPLRFVAESLQCKVDWNPAQQEVLITYAP